MEHKIKEIATDIDELVSIAVVGEPRLDEFASQLFEIESILVSATQMSQLDDCLNSCRRLQGSIAATKSAISNWRDKTNQFLHQLHLFVQNGSLLSQYGKDIRDIEDKITQLLKTFASHLKRIQQQEEKLHSINQSIAARKCELRPVYEKGRPPLLDELEELTT